MYSMVLMMAMTGAPEAVDFGGRGCNGCNGCNGCKGGGLFGGGKGCNGCSGCNGCWSSGHGCSGCNGCKGGGFLGGRKNKGCNGCHGCYGSCYGSSCHGYSGCWGSGYAGCHGGYAGCSGYAAHGCTGGVIHAAPVAPVVVPMPTPPVKKVTEGPAPATIVVTVPAEASLTIDGAATKQTAATRTFVTPALSTGEVFYYTLQADVVRNGKTYSASERVAVKAGEQTTVTLTPADAVASK